MNHPFHAARRHLAGVLFLATTLACGPALAQSWPAKPVSLIVPFPAIKLIDLLLHALGVSA